MSSAVLRLSIGLATWGGVLLGVLSISNWPGYWGHGICGAWGCGPPMQSLVAGHLGWLVLFAPPAALSIVKPVPTSLLRYVGGALLALSAFAILGVIVHERLVWWPEASEWRRDFFWQRCGFVIATTIDLPIAQTALVGAALVAASIWKQRGRSICQPAPAEFSGASNSACSAEQELVPTEHECGRAT